MILLTMGEKSFLEKQDVPLPCPNKDPRAHISSIDAVHQGMIFYLTQYLKVYLFLYDRHFYLLNE